MFFIIQEFIFVKSWEITDRHDHERRTLSKCADKNWRLLCPSFSALGFLAKLDHLSWFRDSFVTIFQLKFKEEKKVVFERQSSKRFDLHWQMKIFQTKIAEWIYLSQSTLKTFCRQVTQKVKTILITLHFNMLSSQKYCFNISWCYHWGVLIILH